MLQYVIRDHLLSFLSEGNWLQGQHYGHTDKLNFYEITIQQNLEKTPK